jgi:hypothetical protein
MPLEAVHEARCYYPDMRYLPHGVCLYATYNRAYGGFAFKTYR